MNYQKTRILFSFLHILLCEEGDDSQIETDYPQLVMLLKLNDKSWFLTYFLVLIIIEF